ncbi:12730_t:CDS:1, partial [Acaulospora colombiana]
MGILETKNFSIIDFSYFADHPSALLSRSSRDALMLVPAMSAMGLCRAICAPCSSSSTFYITSYPISPTPQY